MLPRVETERQCGAECKCGVLAPIIIQRGVAHLDRAVRHGIEHLQTWNDFAGRKRLNLEAIVCDFRNAFAKKFTPAVKCIEGLRPARRVSPLHLWHRLRDRWCSNCACRKTNTACS